MSTTQHLKGRRQVAADPERAYQEWAEALREGLPRTNWDEVEPHPPKEWLWAAELADTPGGPQLADYMDGLVEEDLEESLVIEMIAGCERLKSWAAARQSQLFTELHSRCAGAPTVGHIDDEVRVRLGITSYAAGSMENRARELARFPEVRKALKVGWIDVRKADVLIDGVQTLPEVRGRAVHRMFIPIADGLTPPQLRRRVAAAVVKIDPDLAHKRHEKAKKTRMVSLTPAADGMAWLSAYLPATEAMTAFTAIDVLAGDQDATDERSIGERRADAFSSVFSDILANGVTPGGCTLGTRQGARPHVIITMAASTWAGQDDLPADLVGYGPITAEAARKFAAGKDVRCTTIITDPVDGSYLAGHDGPPQGTHSTHGPGAGGETGADGQSGADGAHAAPGAGRGNSTSGAFGASEAPGADGAGGAAEAAKRARTAAYRKMSPLLYPENVWDKEHLRLSGHDTAYLIELIETQDAADPVAYLRSLGVVATDAYAPSAELRKHLVLRDRSCRFPGCSVPGWRCQIDHIQPFTEDLPAWAQTADTNLQLLCTAHHQLKTAGRWRAWRDRYGATHWVSDNRYHYVVLAQGIDPGTDADLYRIAMAGLQAELGETIEHLMPEGVLDPGCADEYDPANLAHEDNLQVIAAKLREATGCGPDGEPVQDLQSLKAATRSARARPRVRPWLKHVPRRTALPERAQTTRARPSGSNHSGLKGQHDGGATRAEGLGDDESDRTPF